MKEITGMQLPSGLNWIYSLCALIAFFHQPALGNEKSASIGISTGYYNIKEDQSTDKNNNYYSYFLDYTLGDYLLKGQMHHSSNSYFKRYFGLEVGYLYEFDDVYSIYPIIGMDFINSGVDSKLGLGFSASVSNYFDFFIESKFSRANPYGDYFVEAGLKFKLSEFDRGVSETEYVEEYSSPEGIVLPNNDLPLNNEIHDVAQYKECVDPYVIVSGDTLSKIARNCKVYLRELIHWNPKFKKNPDLIFPNQVVVFN
ncbi:LysM peptidoglycan-binding domain-containing protein [Vibrio sp. HENC-03]|uniref:LysM peptidoglycan-binding domain-containing protein n=1 Tax=Vibrio sp. HENC-03 TaxID=992012 RepID=UPI0009F85E16|nr:LysM peptidoglycan-binding domain-containing protein [Vibrio sp. HENC-03]